MKLPRLLILFFTLLAFFQAAEAQVQDDEFNTFYKKAISFQNINTDSILFYGYAAYTVSESVNNPELQIRALKMIINSLIKKGEFSKAVLNCLKADSIISTNNMNNFRAEMLMYKGLVFQTSGLSAEGLRYFFEAKTMAETSVDKSFEAELDYYLAIAYYNINEMEKCREFANMAINEELAKNDSTTILKNLILLSNSFQNTDSINYYLQMAENIRLNHKVSSYNQAALLSNMGLFYKSSGRKKEAKSCYLEAISIAQANGFSEYMATIYNNYAYLLMAESNYDSAGYVLADALEIAKNIENKSMEATVLDSYSDLYAKTGNIEQSLEYYKRSVQLKNKYKAEQQVEESLFLSTVFETEKKQLEIEKQKVRQYKTNAILAAFVALFAVALVVIVYLRHTSAQRKAKIAALEQENKLDIANALIVGQDAERKRLAMDLHDGIMPMIGTLQRLIDNNFEKNQAYPTVKSSIKEIGTDIRELSHRMLPSQLESKGLAASLENYIHLLSQSQPVNIQIHTDLAKRLDAHYEMNIYFLFYEMINNAVKYSGATEIIVQLLDDNDVLNLSVEDNGKGFDTEKDYSGIGLKNIRQRVNYLGGTMAIDSVPGQGTAFLIEIKKPQA